MINPNKRHVAYVDVMNLKTDVIIANMSDRNRSQEGDIVAVEILELSKWVNHSSRAGHEPDDKSTTKHDDSDELEDQCEQLWRPRVDLLSRFEDIQKPRGERHSELDRLADLHNSQPRGRVVSILKPFYPRDLVGHLSTPRGLEEGASLPSAVSTVEFIPADYKYEKMAVRRIDLPGSYTSNPANADGQLFICEVSTWPVSASRPFGVNVRSLGEAGSLAAETEALLAENGISHGKRSLTLEINHNRKFHIGQVNSRNR
jgi:exoribonuclease R